MSNKVDLDYLKSILAYYPDTGLFIWLVNRGRGTAGKRAGYVINDGYRAIGIEGNQYLEHVLAWFYMTGYMPIYPQDEVDHLDRNEANNKWHNLRLTDHKGNANNPGTLLCRASKTGWCHSISAKHKISSSWTDQRKLDHSKLMTSIMAGVSKPIETNQGEL